MGKTLSKNVCGGCTERVQTLETLDEKYQKPQEEEILVNGRTFRELTLLEILKGKEYSTRVTTGYGTDRSMLRDEKSITFSNSQEFPVPKSQQLKTITDVSETQVHPPAPVKFASKQRKRLSPLPETIKTKDKSTQKAASKPKFSARSRSPGCVSVSLYKKTPTKHQATKPKHTRSQSNNFSETTLNILEQLRLQNSILIDDISILDREISRELENKSPLTENFTIDLSPIVRRSRDSNR
ncbi:unnamed protein product [Blepharisma stoltei]|uniref:Uncharacterized protein n=1 Tax=Blepharisma stoltei TaxID=1481888 RepID=A0AAU9IQD7_9CILI|nr:unnamed protein product [Blepharisma stoltei]